MNTFYLAGSEIGKLETRIWEAATKYVYAGREDQVEKLQHRLENHLRDSDTTKTETRRDLGAKLLDVGLKPAIGKVADALVTEYTTDIRAGIPVIYDYRSNDFMPSKFREKRMWLLIYAGLLDVVHEGDNFAQKVLQLDTRVKDLLSAYNNLRTFGNDYTISIHNGEYTWQKGFEILKATIQNIVDISGHKPDKPRMDRETTQILTRLMDFITGESYKVQALILYDFYAKQTATRKRVNASRSQKRFISIQKNRIAQQLLKLSLIESLPAHAREFYTRKAS